MDAIDQEVIERHIELSLSAAFGVDGEPVVTHPPPRRGLQRALTIGTVLLAATVVVVVAAWSRAGAVAQPGPRPPRHPLQDPPAVIASCTIVRAGDDINALPVDTRAVECIRLPAEQFQALRRLQKLETLVISGRIEDENVLFGSRWQTPAEAIAVLPAFADLRVLHLVGDVQPEDLAALPKLTKLTEVWLEDNEVVAGGHLAALQRIPSLRRLRIEGRGAIADGALAQLLSTVQFEQLALRGTFGLTDAGYQGIEMQRSLRSLDLSAPWYCGGPPGEAIIIEEPGKQWPNETTFAVDDSVLQRIGKVGSLCELRLQSRPKITDAGLHQLAALTHLELLDLHQCLGITAAGLGELPPSLRILDLGETTNVAGLPQQLTGLRELTIANGTAFVDAGLSPLGRMPELRTLDLTGCPRLTKACTPVLSGCAKLESLNLHANAWIDDDVLKLVSALTGLHTLDVGSFDGRFKVPTGEGKNGGHTAITAAGVKQLVALKNLTQLNLSSAPPLPVACLRGLRPLSLTKLALWWTTVHFDDATRDLDALSAIWPGAKIDWCEPSEENR